MKTGAVSSARFLDSSSKPLIGLINAPAASLDIAITPGVITKQCSFRILAAPTVELFRNHIAVADIAGRILIPAKAHKEPPQRIVAGSIVKNIVERTEIPMPAPRSVSVAIVTPAIIS